MGYAYLRDGTRIDYKTYIEEPFPLKDKNEIIDCMYEIRYYNLLPYTKDEIISDIDEFNKDIELSKEKIIKKLYDNKIINTISTNEKNDIEIVKNIFDLKIINLEDIYIQIKKKDNQYIIKFYDENETLEKEVNINLEFNKKDKIKLNRKIKLFNWNVRVRNGGM